MIKNKKKQDHNYVKLHTSYRLLFHQRHSNPIYLSSLMLIIFECRDITVFLSAQKSIMKKKLVNYMMSLVISSSLI